MVIEKEEASLLMMKERFKSGRGFSLVELMIVVAILGFMALLAAPNFLEYIPKYRVDAAVKGLSSDVSLARIKAISRNTKHRVTFDATNQTVTVDALNPDESLLETISKSVFDTKPGGASAVAYPINYFPGVKLGRNTTDELPDSAYTGTSSDALKFSGTNAEIIFLPNGMVKGDSLEFFLIPLSEHGKAGNIYKENIRGVQVSRTGMVRKFKYDENATPKWTGF